MVWREPWRRSLPRRFVSTVALVVGTALYLALLPVGLLLAAARDLRAPRREWITVRVAVLLAANLCVHVVGLGALVLAGLAPTRRLRRRGYLAVEVAIERASLGALFRVFGMRLSVEGAEVLEAPGPLLVFPRHASLVDTLLPVVFVAGPRRTHLHYVMKRELLWDPTIDAVGHRDGGAFVDRDTSEHGREIAKVGALAGALASDEAVVLYPEGTRFTEEKRARRLARLAERHPKLAERAEALRHLLAPKLGGPLAALAAAPRADVLFVAHHGLEGANHFEDLLAGSLLHQTVKVRLWRLPAATLPTDDAGRAALLWDWWARIDAWLDARGPAEGAGAAPR